MVQTTTVKQTGNLSILHKHIQSTITYSYSLRSCCSPEFSSEQYSHLLILSQMDRAARSVRKKPPIMIQLLQQLLATELWPRLTKSFKPTFTFIRGLAQIKPPTITDLNYTFQCLLSSSQQHPQSFTTRSFITSESFKPAVEEPFPSFITCITVP